MKPSVLNDGARYEPETTAASHAGASAMWKIVVMPT